MFSSMRKSNRKIFTIAVIVVIFAFVGTIFFSWGLNYVSGKNNYSIIVDGEKIGLQEFYNTYEYINRFNSEQNISSGETELATDSLKQLVQVTLLKQYAEKSQIPVSDVEVSLYIRKMFTDQAVPFTNENYQQFLSGNGINAADYEGSIKESLKRQKILDAIALAVAPNKEELNKQILFFTQTVDIHGVSINPADMKINTKDIYSDEQLREFYTNNINNYSGDTLYNFSYIEIAIEDLVVDTESITDEESKNYYDENKQKYFIPSEIDISVINSPAYAGEFATGLSNSITNGDISYSDAIAQLTQEYGADNITANNNLVYSSSNLPQLYSIARQLKVGSAYIVNTSTILYINSKTDASYESFADVKEDVKKQLTYEYALRDISSSLNRDVELLFDGNERYAVKNTGYFEAKNLPEIFLDGTTVFQSLLASDEGEVSSPIVSEDESSIRIFRTEPIVIGGVRAFQIVRDEVIKDYVSDYSLKAINLELERSIESGEALEDIAKRYGDKSIVSLEDTDYSSGLTQFNLSVEDTFQLYNSPDKTINIFSKNNGILLLSISNKKEGDLNAPIAKFLEYTLNDSIQKAKVNTVQESFVEYLESTATIEYNPLLISQYDIQLDDLNN